MPKDLIKEINNYRFTWDFFGKYVHFDDNEERNEGYRNNFFIIKGDNRWLIRTKDNYLSEEDSLISPYIPPKTIKKFERFQGVRVFRDDKKFWASDEKFYDRIRIRKPLTKEELSNKFVVKYETVFNWLGVSFNNQESFW
jgi:hypothetical protein